MIYTYETLDGKQQFEIVQSIKDNALTTHPDTGVAIKRIITGAPGIKCAPHRSMARFGDYKDSQAYKDALKAKRVGKTGRRRIR